MEAETRYISQAVLEAWICLKLSTDKLNIDVGRLAPLSECIGGRYTSHPLVGNIVIYPEDLFTSNTNGKVVNHYGYGEGYFIKEFGAFEREYLKNRTPGILIRVPIPSEKSEHNESGLRQSRGGRRGGGVGRGLSRGSRGF